MSDNPMHVGKIAREIKLQPNQVRAVRAFLADGATVPFIARYRKEATGSLDEVQITAIRDRLEQLGVPAARLQKFTLSYPLNGSLG